MNGDPIPQPARGLADPVGGVPDNPLFATGTPDFSRDAMLDYTLGPRQKVYVVCTNPETNEHMAFDKDDPSKKVIGYSEADAIAYFIERHAPGIIIQKLSTKQPLPGE